MDAQELATLEELKQRQSELEEMVIAHRDQMEEHCQKLDDHIKFSKNQFDVGADQFEEIRDCMKKNTEALEQLAINSRGVIQLYDDISAAARVGVKVQKIGIWIAKWPLVGGALVVFAKWVWERF